MRILTVLCIFVLFFSVSINAETKINLNGYFRTEVGSMPVDDGQFGLLKNTLSFDLNYRNTDDTVGAKATPFVNYYADDKKVDLRESYIDIFKDTMDIRIGKQQIIWGKADGVFITDIVSPKDMSEYLLPDFEEIRIGIIAAKVNYYKGDNTFELVWIPTFVSTEAYSSSSIWNVSSALPSNASMDYSEKNIDSSFKNSELFLKYSRLSSFIDFELMAGYTWDDDPTLHKSVSMATGSPVITITPKHHRLGLVGGSFGKDIAGLFVVRSEAAFYNKKYFLLDDFVNGGNTIQKDYLHYLIGVDATPFWNITTSIQFIQRVILSYDDNISDEKVENTMTILLKKLFLNDTLSLELFTYYGVTDTDALLKPKVAYKVSDELEISAGAYVFIGDDDGAFGQYKDNTMFFSRVKLNF